MKNVLISVIIPSLNSIKYIRQCVDSVLAQSLRNIEVICVDAGSTDGTLEVLNEYAVWDDRVKVICSEQKSYGYQMNLGMDAAVGRYVGIVESDDYILDNMYESLYDAAEAHNADFVKSNFYRFAEECNCLKKLLVRIAPNQSYYGRLIDIGKEQECFKFTMNTWNGIYKRQFLNVHHIRHNETPGASFQDNGFWFQTFMYAEKALFLDKAYYMNRRDNMDSSIFDKNKSFCVCNEYAFIKNLLEKEGHLRTSFGAAFAYACFNTYRWNLRRILTIDRVEFSKRFAADFRALLDEGYLEKTWFNDEQWEAIIAVMKDPERFCIQEEMSKKLKLSEEIKKYNGIIIYGAGIIGRNVLYDLMGNENFARLIGFAVTDKLDGNTECEGIPVKCIEELLRYREEALVLVAVSAKYQQEIVDTLRKLRFRNVLVW